MHRKFPVALAAIVACLFLVSPTLAQSAPNQDSAELAFDLRMDQLRETPLYGMVSQAVDQMKSQGEMPDEIDFDKVNRVWGAIQFPETVEEMEAMDGLSPGDALPMDLFIQIEFVDAESADAAMGTILEDSEEVSRNGKTYFAPKSGSEAPSNLLGHKVNSSTIEFGTDAYVTAGAGEGLFSNGLGEAWGSFGDEPIRLAFDLDNARTLVDEGLELAKADSPPMMHGMLDLVSKMKQVRLSVDLKDGGNLLSFGAAGTDEEAAEELRSGLDGMLGMAKMMGGSAVEEIRAQDEGMADVVAAILGSLAAKRDGTDVEIVIPKPEGFEDAIQSMMEMNGMGSDF